MTLVLETPLTAAVNCRLPETLNDAVEGLTETLIGVSRGTRDTTAVPDFGGLPADVAVTMTVCAFDKPVGAV